MSTIIASTEDLITVSKADVEFYGVFLITKTLYLENHNFKQKIEKVLRKVGKAHFCYARELNTFMIAHAKISAEKGSSVDIQESIETELRKIHSNYVQRIIKKVRSDVWKDTEVAESRKAMNKAHKFHGEKDTSLVRQQIIGIQRVVYENIHEVVSKSNLLLWEDSNTGTCRLVTHGTLLSEIFPDLKPGEFGSLTDECTLLIFGRTFIRLLEPMLTNLLEITNSFTLMIDTMIVDLSEPAQSKKHRDAVSEVIRVLIGKILGIRETLRMSSRQVLRFTTLSKEMAETDSEVEKTILAQMMEEFFDQEAVAQRDQEVGQLNSLISEIIPKIRDLLSASEDRKITSSVKLEKERMHLTAIGDFYAELEKLRFWTDLWEDIPYFTLMPGGIAFETDEYMGLGRLQSMKKRLGGLIPGRKTETPMDSTVPEDVVLRGDNLFKTYRLANSTIYALRGVNLDVKRGEFVAITGASGSGKTTLLNIISGLDTADRGSVFIDRKNISHMADKELTAIRRDEMGFVFQYYNLLPVLTSNENVALPAELGGDHLRGKALKQRVSDLMEGVQLTQFGNQVPTKLSGGQMQRVTIARSMVNNPSILFADEPTGDLDSVTGLEIMKLIHGFHQQGSSIVLVTHDHEIAQMAERIIELRDGQVIKDIRI